MRFRSTWGRLVAGLGCVVISFASLSACSSSAGGTDFCSAYRTAATQLQGVAGWVDGNGNIDLLKAGTGMIQLIDSLQKLASSAPADVKKDLDKVMPVYTELKDAALSGNQSRIQAAVAKLSDPAVQQALTDAVAKATKACG